MQLYNLFTFLTSSTLFLLLLSCNSFPVSTAILVDLFYQHRKSLRLKGLFKQRWGTPSTLTPMASLTAGG